MKTRAKSHPADVIIRRTILTSQAIAQELRDRLAAELSDAYARELGTGGVLARAREILRQYEPILADLIGDSELYGWVAGYSYTVKRLPDWMHDLFRRPGRPPSGPPRITLPGLLGGGQPEFRFPILDKAMQSLQDREILTRGQYDLLDADARQRAFTVAWQSSNETIDAIREELETSIQEGTSLRDFRQRIKDRFDTSPMGSWHLETVYRTNIQAAFRDGRESLANHPIVRDVFPYQSYDPIHDGRVRDEHEALETLGLSGTNVYRRDDPMWDYFTPPWGYNCRCGVNLMTVEAAARRGVAEARQWLESGQSPVMPEHRLAHIPFRPPAGFGTRGRMTVGTI